MADPTQDPSQTPAPSSGGLLGLDPALLMNMGFGLLQAGGKNLAGQGNIGTALMGGMQNYYAQKQAQQQLNMGGLQYQQLKQEMPLRMGYLKALGQKLHVLNNDPGVTQTLQSVPGLMGAPQAPQAPPSSGLMAPQGAAVPPSPQPPTAMAPQRPAAPMTPGAPQSSNNPMDLMGLGAMGASLGMPGGAEVQKLGETQLQYDPQMATRMEAAKSALAADQLEMQQAQASGNPLGFKAAQMKYLKDSGLVTQSSMNGAVQTFGGITPDMLGMSTYNPQQGVRTVNGVESPIPGAPGTEALLAGAKAGAESGAEYAPIYDANGTQIGFAPRAAIVSQAPRRGGAAPSGGGVAPGGGAAPAGRSGTTFGLGPVQSTMLKGNAETALETNKEYQTQAETGQQMVAQTQTLMNAANDFTPGRFADSRATMLDYLNSAGLITPGEKKQLGSYQEGQKIAIQLQASATKQLGSREAAQIFDKMGKSLPNLTLSQDGLQKVASWQMGISRYQMARAEYANGKAQTNDAVGVNQTRDTWINNSNPLYYVVASAAPATRANLLSSMKDPKQFISDWNAAANKGFAPRPNEYQGR